MNRTRRYVGSGAFHSSARRGRASLSASPQPEQFLKAIDQGHHSIAELTEALDLSPDEVREQLRVLETMGLVTRDGAEAVHYELSPTGRRALEVAFLAVA